MTPTMTPNMIPTPETRIKRQNEETCVMHTHAARTGLSWCGRKVKNEFYFVNIDHAAYSVEQENNLTLCPECVNIILSLFKPIGKASWVLGSISSNVFSGTTMTYPEISNHGILNEKTQQPKPD